MRRRKPKGAGAVMADRVRGEVKADDPRTALYRRLEFFPTPPFAARAGGELIQRIDPGPWRAWEPACGQGHLAHGIGDYFAEVLQTDVHDHQGEGQLGRTLDFTSPSADQVEGYDWLVTNPPFQLAAAFIKLGLKRVRRGVAILARLSFFETLDRYELFFGDRTPVAVVAPFFARVPMFLGRCDPNGSTATSYAWFIFLKPEATPAWLAELREQIGGGAVVLPIGPDAKRRLTRESDRRFIGEGAAPLFDGLGL